MRLSINIYGVSVSCNLRKVDRFKMVRTTCTGVTVPSVYGVVIDGH